MSFDDLLGDPPDADEPDEPRKKAGRPLGSKNLPKGGASNLSLKMQEVHNVASGVSATWLQRVFRMPRYKLDAALTDCPVLRTAQNGGRIYDIKTAAAFLVEPTTDLEAYIQTIKADQLPEKLRETFWNAKIKEAKYRTMAGELWPTGSVLEVLGDTFKTLKKTTQLWIDTVDEEDELSDAQRALLTVLVDKLQDNMYKALVKQVANKSTESFLSELDDDE